MGLKRRLYLFRSASYTLLFTSCSKFSNLPELIGHQKFYNLFDWWSRGCLLNWNLTKFVFCPISQQICPIYPMGWPYCLLLWIFLITRKIAPAEGCMLRLQWWGSSDPPINVENPFGKFCGYSFEIFCRNLFNFFCGNPFGKIWQKFIWKILMKSIWNFLRKSF